MTDAWSLIFMYLVGVIMGGICGYCYAQEFRS